jgi:hypothetical protein
MSGRPYVGGYSTEVPSGRPYVAGYSTEVLSRSSIGYLVALVVYQECIVSCKSVNVQCNVILNTRGLTRSPAARTRMSGIHCGP